MVPPRQTALTRSYKEELFTQPRGSTIAEPCTRQSCSPPVWPPPPPPVSAVWISLGKGRTTHFRCFPSIIMLVRWYSKTLLLLLLCVTWFCRKVTGFCLDQSEKSLKSPAQAEYLGPVDNNNVDCLVSSRASKWVVLHSCGMNIGWDIILWLHSVSPIRDIDQFLKKIMGQEGS